MDDASLASLFLIILGTALLLILSAIALLLIISIILFAVSGPTLASNTRVPKRLSGSKREQRGGNILLQPAQEPSVIRRRQQPRVQDSEIEIVYPNPIAEQAAL